MRLIDSDDYGASGIETFFFPGGEPHARIPENFGDALLFLKPRTWNDVGVAACVLQALRYQGHSKGKHVWLFCPYFPGARQDRTDYRTPITKDIMMRILGDSIDRLYVFDMHSNTISAGRAHIEQNFMPSDMLHWVTNPFGRPLHVIAPDAGATARAQNFADHIRGYDGKRQQGLVPVIQCRKKRNFATGAFEGFKLPPLPAVGHYVVVDDICDGGGTFNLLAEEFLKDPLSADSTLSLWVSHGIFSKGVSNIHPKYRSIYTTDSWFDEVYHATDDDQRVNVVSLRPIIDKILEDEDSA